MPGPNRPDLSTCSRTRRLRRGAAARRGRRARGRGGRGAARADRPRHGRRRRRGAGRGARARHRASSPPWSSPRCTAATRTCTSSATRSTTPTPAAGRRWRTSAPTASGASCAMADRLRELGFELDDAARSRRGSRRPPAPRRRGARAPRQRRAAARGGHRRPQRDLPAPTWSPARRPTSRARGRPWTRRSTVIHAAGGVAVWAHPFLDIDDPAEALARSTPSRPTGSTAWRPSTPPTTAAQTRLLADAAPRAGAAHHRLGGLPRPRARAFDRFRAFELYGLEPALGPIG